ncbi:stress-response A/B barrel domain-containing protein At5g22580 isoform X1 [Triticum aestivum]|uniref:stress-response A/B barrel domain-containing protein At5g22580 isoform X1 n=1 Tax=Triticum aestivum TaxID=4565 RepID=UPI0008448399|nr:stress-response A/B barrel domain-containing protein At5g22580-like isoform X1 [Triticum aestivum]
MEFKHLCLVRFKEGVVVEDIIEELTKLAAELDTVKFFGWSISLLDCSLCWGCRGKDVLNQEALTQGFTHVFSMSFASAEDLAACMGHEKHSAFAATFMAVLDKVVVLDFPFVVAKPAPSPEAA